MLKELWIILFLALSSKRYPLSCMLESKASIQCVRRTSFGTHHLKRTSWFFINSGVSSFLCGDQWKCFLEGLRHIHIADLHCSSSLSLTDEIPLRLLRRVIKYSEIFSTAPGLFVRVAVGVMALMAVSSAVHRTSSLALSEENQLFLEAWRAIDRAYVDKTFNGQSWFRYRENALRNDPMNNREETYAAIRKMVATLDDPFTRFLEPEKFTSLRSGTQSALTGVGISIGYPSVNSGATTGLMVISVSPGGPANRADISSGDVILAINDIPTESMGIYDAAERLQGPEGSGVEVTVQRGSETRNLSLMSMCMYLSFVDALLQLHTYKIQIICWFPAERKLH